MTEQQSLAAIVGEWRKASDIRELMRLAAKHGYTVTKETNDSSAS